MMRANSGLTQAIPDALDEVGVADSGSGEVRDTRMG